MTAIGPGVRVRCVSLPNKLCPARLPAVGCVYTVGEIHMVFNMISLVEIPDCTMCPSAPLFSVSHFRPIDDEGEAEIRKLKKLVDKPTRVLEPV